MGRTLSLDKEKRQRAEYKRGKFKDDSPLIGGRIHGKAGMGDTYYYAICKMCTKRFEVHATNGRCPECNHYVSPANDFRKTVKPYPFGMDLQIAPEYNVYPWSGVVEVLEASFRRLNGRGAERYVGHGIKRRTFIFERGTDTADHLLDEETECKTELPHPKLQCTQEENGAGGYYHKIVCPDCGIIQEVQQLP